MAEDCIDPNEPSVDNTSLDCDELTGTDCTISSESDAFLNYGKGVTLTSIIEAISRKLRKLTTAQTTFLPTYTTYKVALLQAGTSVPTEAIIYNNGLAVSATLTRVGVGDYNLLSTGTFILAKTTVKSPDNRATFTGVNETTIDKFYAERVDVDNISIKTSQKTAGGTVLSDGLLDGVNTVLEIRVYN